MNAATSVDAAGEVNAATGVDAAGEVLHLGAVASDVDGDAGLEADTSLSSPDVDVDASSQRVVADSSVTSCRVDADSSTRVSAVSDKGSVNASSTARLTAGESVNISELSPLVFSTVLSPLVLSTVFHPLSSFGNGGEGLVNFLRRAEAPEESMEKEQSPVILLTFASSCFSEFAKPMISPTALASNSSPAAPQ